ncbi:hypothetical protein DYB25_011413 [Aphanomyces astaci]|uniref:HTH CENPB-type domain-containing protein n=1 Tax=Aphanomyces astaci TaxID=112090 RepID=A0A397AES7_APHAT|nr:hypothetical protein DYB25_011413 [Aphanomyces astaci]
MESEAPRAARRPSTGRPVFKNWAKKRPKQHKNTVADYRERKAAIDHYELFGVQSTLDSMYGRLAPDARETKRKLIYSWVANRPLIERMASNPRTATMKCRRDLGTGTTLTAEAEEQLVQWVKGMRADGVPVTYSMLRIMALEAAIDLGLSEDEFRAGWHWVDGFKRRHGLSLRARTRIGQQTPEDGDEVLDDFAKRVQEIVAREGIDIIYNADQTAVNYEYLPTKTLNKKGENTVWVKCGGKTKDRMTAMLLADNSGTKHPLFLILRTSKSKIKAVVQENLTTRQGFGKRLWESVEPMQAANGVVIHGNPTAWWNASISMQFLKYHFSERHDRATKKVMLIWDDFSAHFTDEVTAYAKEGATIEGRISYPANVPPPVSIDGGLPSLQVVLDGGARSTLSTHDGRFYFYDVPAGRYTVDIHSPVYIFSQFKVDISTTGDIRVLEFKYPGTPKLAVSHPLVVDALAQVQYFQVRQVENTIVGRF